MSEQLMLDLKDAMDKDLASLREIIDLQKKEELELFPYLGSPDPTKVCIGSEVHRVMGKVVFARFIYMEDSYETKKIKSRRKSKTV